LHRKYAKPVLKMCMRSGNIIKAIAGFLLFFCFPVYSFANTGKPVLHLGLSKPMLLAADSLPPVEQPVAATDKPAIKVIKVVPKARKQAIPVKVNVKPIIPVKPKIIRPIIKIIH
jgi:hypothetical protein